MLTFDNYLLTQKTVSIIFTLESMKLKSIYIKARCNRHVSFCECKYLVYKQAAVCNVHLKCQYFYCFLLNIIQNVDYFVDL